MPRTTIHLENHVIVELKHLAAESRESMSQTINRLLVEALERVRADQQTGRPPLTWSVVENGAPAPGFDPANRDYLDQLDEDHP